MITLNKIIDGICEALNTEFGDDFEIYTEDVKQGLKEPCFSVVLLNPSVEQFLGKRYHRNNLFCIHYFPKSKHEAKAECFDVQERLQDCLELIAVDGDLTRGTGMHGEVVEGVLSFFVDYDMFVYKEQETSPVMETIKQSTDVKG